MKMMNLKQIFKRFSSLTDKKSQVKSAEAQVENFKEYDLEVEGDPIGCLCYYINIYVGEKKLRFHLDSGSADCQVGFRFIKNLPHHNLGISAEHCSVTGVFRTKSALVKFGLEPGYAEEDAFCLQFSMVTKKEGPYYNEDSVGLLGATFLQFCEVDFRNAKIRVYRKSGSMVQSLLNSMIDLQKKILSFA